MMNLFTAGRPMRLWLSLALFGLAGPAWSGSANDFDFWLGQWNLTWGSDGQATNQVSRILDEQVILEQFDARPGDQLAGMSVTVYDAKADQWKQTWVDNTGAQWALIKGYSTNRWLAWLAVAIWLLLADRGSTIWVERVHSKDNLADWPSRFVLRPFRKKKWKIVWCS